MSGTTCASCRPISGTSRFAADAYNSGDTAGQKAARACRAPGPAYRRQDERIDVFRSGEACRGACVLDLFAGSGALGFEALSRGAIRATFVEKNKAALKVLAENARSLGLEETVEIVRDDVFSYLGALAEDKVFDLCFADPPFKNHPAQALLSWWPGHSRKGSIFVLEYPSGFPLADEARDFELVKKTTFGESSYSIYLAG